MDTPSHKALLVGQTQFPGIYAAGDDDGFRLQSAAGGGYLQRLSGKIHASYLVINGSCAKTLGALLHFHTQSKSVDAFVKAGVVIDDIRQSHLTAGGELFYHYGVQTGAGSIQRGGVASRAAADDQYIKHACHISLPA